MKSSKIYLAIGVFLLSFTSCAAPPRPPKPPTPPKRPSLSKVKPSLPTKTNRVFASLSPKAFAPE